MHDQADQKVKKLKLKLNKKTVESLDDNQLRKVSGGEPSFGSGCISIRSKCCETLPADPSFGGSGCISINTGCC